MLVKIADMLGWRECVSDVIGLSRLCFLLGVDCVVEFACSDFCVPVDGDYQYCYAEGECCD